MPCEYGDSREVYFLGIHKPFLIIKHLLSICYASSFILSFMACCLDVSTSWCMRFWVYVFICSVCLVDMCLGWYLSYLFVSSILVGIRAHRALWVTYVWVCFDFSGFHCCAMSFILFRFIPIQNTKYKIQNISLSQYWINHPCVPFIICTMLICSNMSFYWIALFARKRSSLLFGAWS